MKTLLIGLLTIGSISSFAINDYLVIKSKDRKLRRITRKISRNCDQELMQVQKAGVLIEGFYLVVNEPNRTGGKKIKLKKTVNITYFKNNKPIKQGIARNHVEFKKVIKEILPGCEVGMIK